MDLLLIEDNPLASTYVKALLERKNQFRVEHVETVSQALERLSNQYVDLILLDLFLPDSEGLETLYKITQFVPGIPVVVLSSLDDEDICIQAVKEGAQDYLIKGTFDNNQLSRSIYYALERKKTIEERRISEERYALAARGTNDGIWEYEVEKDCFYASDRWISMIDRNVKVKNLSDWTELVHPQDSEKLKKALDEHIHTSEKPLKIEYRIASNKGEYRWFLCRGESVRDSNGKSRRISGSQTDITEYRLQDTLTGLPDRKLFEDRLGQALLRFKNQELTGFTVLYLDIDRFSRINESFGIPAGDGLLIQVASRLQKVLNITDTVCRVAGDEFLILAEFSNENKASISLIPHIIEVFKIPFQINQHDVFLTASIGVIGNDSVDDSFTGAQIITEARNTSARAKRNSVALLYYNQSNLEDSIEDKIKLESELRKSIEKNELKLYYQPKLNLHTGVADSAEALIRWQRSDGKLMPPDQFLPIAEESGFIAEITEWTIQTALTQIKSWLTQGLSVRVAVNLSPTQFRLQNIAEIIKNKCNEIGVSANHLEVEFTETVAVSQEERTVEALHEIKKLGTTISIDDFGTGYSSLTYLKKFPIDTVKIDKEFVMSIPADTDSMAIVTAIIAMSKSLHLDVVAEGVEEAEQLEFLKERKCDFIQGYFFAKPMPSKQATEFLKTTFALNLPH